MTDATDVLGRRLGAGLVDVLVVLIIFLGLGAALGGATSEGTSVGVQVRGLEALTGQTIGKRVFGVRVVRVEDGGPPSAGRIALRTLLRIVDGILLYLVAVVLVLATGKRRARLGDLAGRTSVVRA